MRKLTAGSLAALLLFQALPASAAEDDVPSGTWYGLDWTLQDHVLTVSGNGSVVVNLGFFHDPDEYPDWNTYADEIYEVVFDEGVTGVEDNAFRDYKQLRRVTLPSTFTHLCPYAFYGDEALTEIVGLEHVTEFDFRCLSGTAYIAEHPFVITEGKLWYAECTDFTVPDGVTEIMPFAFGNLTDDVFLPLSSSDAEEVVSPIVVTLPEGVEIIHEKAFAFCAGLTAVNFPESLYVIGDYAFFDCANLGDVTLGKNVEYIGNRAFFNCRSIGTLTVENPDAVWGTNAYGLVYDWNAVLEEKRDNYTDEEYAKNLALIAEHPTMYDEALASFSVHFLSTHSYQNIKFQDPMQNESAALFVNAGKIAGHTGSTAQTFAEENDIAFSSIRPLPGDVTLDDCVDIVDVIVLNKYILGVTTLNERSLLAADYNGDGIINENDSLGTLRHVVKIE